MLILALVIGCYF